MSALNLPKPKNTYAGEDELRNTASTPINGTNGDSNGNGATPAAAEDEGEYVAPKPSDRFKEGLIYPPREVRSESNG
jgi:splicing factor 3A subunit 1